VIDTKIIDGKKLADKILDDLKGKIIKASKIPTLAIILIGQDPASAIYVNTKLKQATSLNLKTRLIQLPSTSSQDELISIITQLNNDSDISGIIVQLPLPLHIKFSTIIEAINPSKDVDGFHPINVGRLHNASSLAYFVPCTALAVMHAIDYKLPNIAGKNVVIVNRSSLIGKPLSALLLQKDATVTICHSQSVNLKHITRSADIIVCAIGRPNFFDKSYFKQDATIIDVGISRQEHQGKSFISGDVDFDNVRSIASYITPVPGGIGPLTVAYLLSNTCKFL
jgi:methylenetetrahydrofolate dehydrogenase (NADP+)/methenyltetrahydrofolate cyclohydrolase